MNRRGAKIAEEVSLILYFSLRPLRLCGLIYNQGKELL